MITINDFSEIPRGKIIYIYGTGVAGRKIFDAIRSRDGIIVHGFIDSYSQGNIDGLPILHPLDNQDALNDAVILIASQSWVEIQQKLSKLGFKNIYNAYPLYSAPSLALTTDNGFRTGIAHAALTEAITGSSQALRFAIIGHGGSAVDLITTLRALPMANRIVGCWDTGLPGTSDFHHSISTLHEKYAAQAFDVLILAVGASDLRSVIRRLRTILGIDAPLWVPARHLDNLGIPRETGTPLNPHLIEIQGGLTERHGDPLVVVVPPCAGTMRFLPQIENLLLQLGWTARAHIPLTTNPHFFSKFRDQNKRNLYHSIPDLAEHYVRNNTESYHWFIKSLRNYEYLTVHDHSIDLSRFSNLDCRIIVLMRDPRDVVNSYFYRIYPWSNPTTTVEKFMLDLLDGQMEFLTPEAGYRWASAGEWTASYLAAQESPNMEIVRFEDLHRDEIGTLRALLSRLELYPNPFIDVSDESLRIAARLGSFEHQTNGQASRGENRQAIVGQTSCRKGVVGDWRSTFTPAVVDKFKRLTGDALIRLGYESSMDWGIDT